ncbi:MAG: hypothetical protein AB7F19_00110 [Candidatus Babeliales bacterium]
MKRLIYITLVCFVQTTWCMDALWIDEEDTIILNSLTQSVHQRYYYIARLSKVHELLKTLQCTCPILTQEFQTLSYLAPEHPRIIQCINELQTSRTCEPLLAVWQEIKAYKYLEDEQCIKEYSSLVCIIAQQLITALQEKLSADDKKTLTILLNRATYENEAVNSPDIVYRYYIIKRLRKVMQLLKLYELMPLNCAISAYLPDSTHAKIAQCADAMEKSNTFAPLLTLLKEFECYQGLEDVASIYQMLHLILLVEQQVLVPQHLPDAHARFTASSKSVESLSVEELLKSIDIMTAHLEPYARKEKKVAALPSVCMLAALACSSFVTWYALSKI